MEKTKTRRDLYTFVKPRRTRDRKTERDLRRMTGR